MCKVTKFENSEAVEGGRRPDEVYLDDIELQDVAVHVGRYVDCARVCVGAGARAARVLLVRRLGVQRGGQAREQHAETGRRATQIAVHELLHVAAHQN